MTESAHNSKDSDEPRLIQLACEGDRRAFGALVLRHQERVYSCAAQMLGDRGEAEDAVQETFVRAWRALDRFDGRSKLSTWLYRICVNVCLNALRRRKRVSSRDVEDPRTPEPIADPTQRGNDPERHAATVQLYGRLGEALDALSPSLRTAVVLVLLQGMSHGEASVALGIPEGTVAWRIHEARRRMRFMLADLVEPAIAGKEAS